MLARRQVGRLRCFHHRRQRGQVATRTSGWSASTARATARSRPARRANRAALEPGREISVVHFVAPRQGQGQPGLAARPQRRRSDAAHRRQGTPAGLRMVARLEAPGPGGRRSRIPTPSIGRRRRRRRRRRGAAKAPKPIVIDRYKFKQDGQGYLLSGRHSYIYLFDIAHEEAGAADRRQVGRIRRHPGRPMARASLS